MAKKLLPRGQHINQYRAVIHPPNGDLQRGISLNLFADQMVFPGSDIRVFAVNAG